VKVIVLNADALKDVVWIVFGLKLLVIEGGCKMIMPAFAVPPPQMDRPEGAV